jgi:hypothetical protein
VVQLSVAVGAFQLTVAWQEEFAFAVMFERHPEITGLVMSFTMTLKVQTLTFPAASVAVYFTCVVPFGNVAPGACVDVSTGVPQLSVAVGGVHVPTAWHEAFALNVMVEGHPVMTGFVTSLTITLNVQTEELPFPSVAVYLTCVVPMLKRFPGLCVLVSVSPPQLSKAVGTDHVATAWHEVLALTTISAEGHPVMTGPVLS